MPRPRVLTVIGTRPEAIKMAPVVRAFASRPEVEHRVALTGQHTDLVDRIMEAFGIEASYDLALMKPGQTLYDIGRACLEGMRDVLRDFRPDVTLVQGDTATVFFTGLTSFFEKGRLGHVEAGLRSHEKWSPFPEEILRRMVDTLSDYCFAPTRRAAKNLTGEGMPASSIFVTGNTVVDALHQVSAARVPVQDPTLARALTSGRRLVLLTAHRRESFGAPIRELFGAVKELAARYDDVQILYPVHPNPQVRGPAEEILAGQAGIELLEPLSYTDLIHALENADLVLTDSGGIQEEAPTFGTPVLVLRDVTERPEGVDAGVATLVGTDPDRILEAAGTILACEGKREDAPNPYGDGLAGARIADIVVADLTDVPRVTQDWDAG
ncbi:MAG: UDP-N-acetylglucosamine 2-epimerase (non-hydrolyzing) [Gemmatimonadota bacterium]|nr:UDP-N-acetylglucosamine 2-epimerase (non-hydrolyzing) [Gemmatimonadota bacterium]